MVTNEFVVAIKQLSAEKNLDVDSVFEAVEAAMASAFKNDELQYADIEAKIDQDSGDITAWRRYAVIDDDEIEDDEIEVSPERAHAMGFADAAIGEFIREPIEQTPGTGRIAAQTAKQVVLQRLREAEREAVYEEYTGKEGDLVSGSVLRVEGGHRQVIIDLGRAEAVLPAAEQIRPEHYRVGQRLRVYVKEVYKASKGPQVVVSRSHPELIRRLFELEVPEVGRGTVEIMDIARDAGYRTKVAVISRQDGIDPIGASVGVRGSRIQNIVNELNGERIDLIRWDPDEVAYITNTLSPAEVVSIRLDEDENTAYIAVPDKQMSLAIGKEGQNARLAARLTRRRIDIRPESDLMAKGDDMYPPPEPNMAAIPLTTTTTTLPTLPEAPAQVAPSQAEYSRPGLPGEGTPEPLETAATVAAQPALTPEQEVLAELQEAEPVAQLPAEAPAEVVEAEQRPAASAGGLRFAEDIGIRRDLDDEAPQPQRQDRRRRRRGAAQDRLEREERPGRRFEVSDEDIEEGLSELRGDGYDDDTEEDEDEQSEHEE